MPRATRRLSELWANQIEVDYYSAFIKSWIALNAWMNYKIGEVSDTQKLEKVIDDSLLKDNICRKIREQDDKMFLQRISKLHEILENKELHNQGKKISLSTIIIKRTPVNTEVSRYRTQYSFKCEANKNKCIMKMASGEEFFNFIDDVKNYNLDKLEEKMAMSNLTEIQKGFARAFYKELAPTAKINLLKVENDSHYMIGEYKFIKNESHIFNSLINTIYDVRCLLFHGDVDPEDHLDLYENAYFITKSFVEAVNK